MSILPLEVAAHYLHDPEHILAQVKTAVFALQRACFDIAPRHLAIAGGHILKTVPPYHFIITFLSYIFHAVCAADAPADSLAESAGVGDDPARKLGIVVELALDIGAYRV